VLTRVDVFGLQTVLPALVLPLDSSVSSAAIQVKDISGLDPVKASITTSPYGTYNGEFYGGSSVGKRNIVLTMGLNPDWATQTIAELRKQLYKYFMSQLPVRLRFTSTHLPTCQIDGYVESVEPNIFSKDPECQVSILCPEPDFVAVAPTVLSYGPMVGVPPYSAPFILDYEGNVPTGFNLSLSKSSGGAGAGAQIKVTTTAAVQRVFTAIGLIDSLTRWEMNSVPGKKYVRDVVLATSAIVNRLYSVSDDSLWPILLPGTNELKFTLLVSDVNWAVSYYARFGGL
jgi:hypothetical protein